MGEKRREVVKIGVFLSKKKKKEKKVPRGKKRRNRSGARYGEEGTAFKRSLGTYKEKDS